MPRQPRTAHSIHALLQTMRAIHQHEDQFCTLMHSIERTGKLSAADSRELHALLDQMPADSFQHDLEAVRDTLRPRPTRKAATSPEPAHAH